MRKITLILICTLLFSLFSPYTFAEAPTKYKVQISIIDNNGNAVDVSGARSYISFGKSSGWGKGRLKYCYASEGIDIISTEQYVEFTTTSYDDIFFTLSSDNGDYACFISDVVSKQTLKNNITIKKAYKLSDLKKISLKTDFMNRSSGRYEVSIYNPQYTNFEADNYGSLFEMKADGTKVLYATQGMYNYVFKYIDKGIGALTYKDNVNAKDTKVINITKDNVSLSMHTYKIPKALEQYIYFIVHADIDNHRSYLTGLFSDNSTLDLYMDKRVDASRQSLILSKDPDDEYANSVWLPQQNMISSNLGNSFSPGKVEIQGMNTGLNMIRIEFEDINGNSIRYIGMNSNKDTIIEIYDRHTGVKLYESTFSRYWDYFNPELENGSYVVKVYPVEKSLGIDSCSYYDLIVDGTNPNMYQFIKLFSLKL